MQNKHSGLAIAPLSKIRLLSKAGAIVCIFKLIYNHFRKKQLSGDEKGFL